MLSFGRLFAKFYTVAAVLMLQSFQMSTHIARPLDTLTIRGFKSIEKLEDFQLSPQLNIIIGANGAGKSNLIDFFRMLSAMMRRGGLKEFIAGNADSYVFAGPQYTKAVEVQLKFGDNGYDFILEPTEEGFFLINQEKRHYFPSDTTKYLGNGNFDAQLLIDSQSPANPHHPSKSWHTYTTMRSWQIYHFHDTSSTAAMRRYHNSENAQVLMPDAANIAPFLAALRRQYQQHYQEIIQAIRLILPFFDDFIFQPNHNNQLWLDWRQQGMSDFPMRPRQLSDGSMRFICLATALLQPNPPATIIIDEPELGLHPEAIDLLAELIHDAKQRSQLIIASQSASLLNYCQPRDIIVVNRLDGASTFGRLDAKALSVWLEDYSLGELWQKNVIQAGTTHG